MARRRPRKPKGKTKESPAREAASALDSYLAAGPGEREESLERLRAGLPGSLSPIVKRLTREEGAAREDCLDLLRRLGDKRAVPRLEESLREGFFSVGELKGIVSLMKELGEGEDVGEPGRSLPEAESLLQELLSSPAEVSSALRFSALPAPFRRALLGELLGRSEEALRGLLQGLIRARALQEVPPVASDVAQSIGRSESPRAPYLLRELLPSLPREASREVRKALFRLKERGFLVEEEREERRPPKPSPLYAEGFTSAVDGLGGQIVIVARARRPLGRYLLQAHINDRKGLLDFVATEMRARDLKGYLTEVQEREAFPVVEAPISHCFRLLEGARERGQGSSEALDRYVRMRGLIAELVSEKEQEGHPAFAVLGKSPEGEGTPEIEWKALLREGPFRSWTLEPERVEAYVEELKEASESRLVLSPLQREERFQSICRRAAGELFSDPELRAVYAGRLLEMAYFLAKRGKEAEGRLALEASGELGAGGDEPAAFFQELVLKSIALRWTPPEGPSPEGREEGDEGLIIRP